MIARTVEPHTDGRGSYWLAAGPAYGRTILAEGETRREAIKAWTQGAAERQGRQYAHEQAITYQSLTLSGEY